MARSLSVCVPTLAARECDAVGFAALSTERGAFVLFPQIMGGGGASGAAAGGRKGGGGLGDLLGGEEGAGGGGAVADEEEQEAAKGVKKALSRLPTQAPAARAQEDDDG